MSELEFYAFHNGAYPWVPHKSVIAEHSRSNFISLPTQFYDEALAQRHRTLERPLHGNLLVEQHADEQRSGVVLEEQVGLGVSGDRDQW